VQQASDVAEGNQAPVVQLHADHLVRPVDGPVLTQLHVSPQDGSHQSRAIEEWDLGPFTHLRELRFGPSLAHRGFHFQMRGGNIGELLYSQQYADEFSGISGNGRGNDPVIAHFILSGHARFEDETSAVDVNAGQAVFRDTGKPWRFWLGPGTRSRILTVPRDLVTGHAALKGRLPRLVVANASLPEIVLLETYLNGYLNLVRGLGGEGLSSIGRAGGQEAGIQLLLAAMGAASAADAENYLSVTAVTARRFIDEHLANPDLAPAAIARAMNISVRTLYRAFGETDESLMAYVRRQRLRRARAQLINPEARVADVAARWQFSDTSHFIRQFKALYGTTPAAYKKGERRSVETDPDGPTR
jgi:AraC-like DNA-binding protein